MPATPAAAIAAPAPDLDHAAVRTIIVGVLLAMLLAALDQTIVATALPTIGQALGDIASLPWIVSAYLLTSTAATPLYGKLSDIHGRRLTLLTSIGIFILGSVACALAPTMLVLILARALQGLGGGGLIALAQTIIADVVSPRERARYQGYIASVFVTSSVAGPVLGGFLAQHLHWSAIFWINLPLGLAAYRMTDRALRRLPRHDRRHRLDVLGAVLMTAASVALLLALTWGGTRYPWLSWPVGGLVAAAVVLAALFALRLATAQEPLLPPSLLRNPVVSRGTATATCVMGVFIGLSINIPVWFETVLGLSASRSGLALIPLMGGVVAGATASGRLMAHVRRYKRLPTVGLLVALAGTGLLAFLPPTIDFVLVELILLASGLGVGTVLPVTTVAVQNAVAMHELGTATGVMNFFRSLGGAVVVAGFGAIVLGSVAGEGVSLDALGAAAAGAGVDLARVFQWVFAAATAGLALGLVFLLLMEERPLRGGGGGAAAARHAASE